MKFINGVRLKLYNTFHLDEHGKRVKWTGGFDEACEVEDIFVKLVGILFIKYTIFKKICLNKFGGQLLFMIYSISTRIFFLKNHHRCWIDFHVGKVKRFLTRVQAALCCH